MMRFNFLRKIRNLLRGNKMSFEFKDIHVADIENEISLKSKGEVDGKNNLPSVSFESNEDSLDGFDLAEFEPR